MPARESYQTDRSSVLRLHVPLINKPKILFADEPTANPDRISSKQILDLFRDTLADDPEGYARATRTWISGPE